MSMYAFRLPDIGEGVAEGEVVAWHVEPGQHVTEDQDMVEVMTDKATVTIGAPRAGRIAQLNANIGERVLVGSVLVVIDTSEAGDAHSERRLERPSKPPDNDTARSRFQAPAASSLRTGTRLSEVPVSRESAVPRPLRVPEGGTSASAVGDIRESLPGASFFATRNGPRAVPAQAESSPQKLSPAQPRPVREATPQAAQTTHAAFFADKPLATPATRKLARDLGVDLRRVPPSGEGGRVTKSDVRGFSGEAATPSSRDLHQAKAPSLGDAQREDRKPFVGLRRRIAERMQMTTQKAAHFTFVEEVEVDALVRLIERLRPSAETHGVKLNYLPFIVKAVTLALKKHPVLNSALDEAKNELVYKRYYHVGVATATDQGLVVPVVRDADQKSPLELAREIARLSEGARTGSLASSELTGSTFTVTSLGKLGGLLATPVLNYPEVGILGVHRVKEKPVVRDGQIVIGKVMLLSLSLDHRIVDGHVGAAFAYDVIAYLENPDLLLLELA